MLFMDASELDGWDGEAVVANMLEGHVEREFRKAFTAFSAGTAAERDFEHVVTGLWGCGAFLGDRQVKALIQWVTASLCWGAGREACGY